jgi:hypothetical protein
MRSKIVGLLLLAALGGVTVQGAEPAPQRVQLRFVSLHEPIIGAGLAETAGQATPLIIPSDSLSPAVTHSTGRLRLVSTQVAPQPTKAAGPIRPEDIPPQTPGFRKKRIVETISKVKAGTRELGWIDLPTGDQQRYIILVHPGKGSGLTAIPDRLGSFPPSSDRYVNLTAASVIIDIPAGRQTLPPNGSIVLRPGAAHSRQYQLRLLTKTDGEEKLLFSAFTAQDDGRRNLRIFIPGGPQGEGIILKSISDGLAAEDNYR